MDPEPCSLVRQRSQSKWKVHRVLRCMPEKGSTRLLYASKRGGSDKGGQGLLLADMGTASQGVIDREAATRMSGQHQMSLIS